MSLTSFCLDPHSPLRLALGRLALHFAPLSNTQVLNVEQLAAVEVDLDFRPFALSTRSVA